MRWRFSLTAVSGTILLSAASASAQDVFVTPIPNSPFSGSINVERSVVQPNGSTVSFKAVESIGRDTQGRIYYASRALSPDSSSANPQVVNIHLYDPQTRVSTMLYPQKKTFQSFTVNRPPATEPPALLYASPAGSSLPASQFAKEEDLGSREIEGLPLHGVRETQTIPADDSGNGTGKEIVITDEYWYSADLRINMVIRHNDPRTGSLTMTVNQVTRTDPDPSLFAIPDGYAPIRPGQASR